MDTILEMERLMQERKAIGAAGGFFTFTFFNSEVRIDGDINWKMDIGDLSFAQRKCVIILVL